MKNEKIDARKIDTKAQQEKRNIAMKLREKGMKNLEVADIVGVHHCTISQWYSKYKKDKKLIVVAKRGRVKGSNKRLSDEQEEKIIRMLIDTTPEQLKFKFALWTREAGANYSVEFNAEDIPDGIYIYRIANNSKVINGRLILVK